MSQQQRRRLRSHPTPRRVGEPNVLSDQATPNRLSTLGSASRPAGGASVAPASQVRPASAETRVARPTTPMGVPTGEPADEAPARRRRVPSFGTLLFVAFVIYWAVRAFGNSGFGEPAPTTAPQPTAVAGQATPSGPVGLVTFGTGMGDDCNLDGAADAFSRTVDVWWRAELSAVQSADADAVVLTFQDDKQIGREFVAAEPSFGEWSVLCAGAPTVGVTVGRYRVEVWDGRRTVLLATGAFERTP